MYEIQPSAISYDQIAELEFRDSRSVAHGWRLIDWQLEFDQKIQGLTIFEDQSQQLEKLGT